jgi:hypothetical protein
MNPPEWSGNWLSLGQAWRGPSGVEPGFHPAQARARRTATGLRFEVVLNERGARNRAVRLNERAWRLGSVCEIFLKHRADRYFELHVTPENRRLQLDWPDGGLAEVRAGRARLEDFMVSDESWCRSATGVQDDEWWVEVEWPITAADLRAAVCRYDCSQAGQPLLSSTAPLTEAAFHRWQEWHRLRLD